ncbi:MULTISPECIES: SLAP domain-containing protein [Lactobacillus]|uniref:YSIRK-type signal peptide-containing protein n=1 Tax=Lactobacillus xujianguonis TaxID=2495899 RepID=A0A437SV15_9LACO|nr:MULTISPECIES: SLAP domain-containing protein [Lactobacillus]RVU70765.1 YSIRK-type signal peptide-containing protein [Lactobacillus xujianguonis]
MTNKHNLRFFNTEKQRFSLRKLSVGVASVLLGVTFLSFSNHAVDASVENISSIQNTDNQIDKTDENTEIETETTTNSNQTNEIDSQETETSKTSEKVSAYNQKNLDNVDTNNTKTEKLTTNVRPTKNNQLSKATTNNKVETSKKSVNVEQPERVSVHDPSIFKDPKTGKYYIFGSHQAEAESDDLYSWKPLFKKEYEQPSYIFNNYDKDLKQIFKWAGSHDGDNPNGYAIWAPDEIYNSDYKWADGSKGAYMYYFSTSDSWIHSAIGFAISKTVHGPYKFVDTVIYSGFTKDKEHNGDSSKKNDIYTNTNLKNLIDSGKVDGFSSKWVRPDGTYNNDYAPNAIDVNIVTDKDNNLWMSYGSWSGGIYLLPLNKETGLPIYPGKDSTNKYGQRVDRYFGTHLIGGFHESGEAPYIKYDKNTGYYYLFTTYGGLTREGGYNMRIFRSKEINGKYVDALGQHPVYTEWKTNDSTKQENQKYGLKLEGNYDFTCLPYTYMSPGHNSAYIDKDGNWFLINHTRFNHGTEYHEVRVKPMIMTNNGWPIPLPFEYTGHEQKIDSNNVLNVLKQISGNYEFVNNGRNTSGKPIPKANITLRDNHQITGDFSGTWSTNVKDNHIYLTLKAKDGSEYIGEFKLQQDESKKHVPVLVFAAEGNNEVLWGVKSYQEQHKSENKDNDTQEPTDSQSGTSSSDSEIPSHTGFASDEVDSSINTQTTQSINTPITPNSNVSSKVDSNLTNNSANEVPDKKVVSATQQNIKLIHAAFIYNEKGERIKNIPKLKAYKHFTVITPAVTINGRKFYQLANNKGHYIAVGNVSGKKRILSHNAYLYNNHGKRVKKIIFKKGTKKLTYGSPIRIGKHLYYRIGHNKYIRYSNFQ